MLSSSERKRIREVRRYYKRSPGDPPIAGESVPVESPETVRSVEKASSPNSTLTALMQLITWRLGASRAMVSVVDDNAQVFVIPINTSFAAYSHLYSTFSRKQQKHWICQTLQNMIQVTIYGWVVEGKISYSNKTFGILADRSYVFKNYSQSSSMRSEFFGPPVAHH